MVDRSGTPLVEMRDVSVAFGGIKAVDHVSVDLYPCATLEIIKPLGKSVLRFP